MPPIGSPPHDDAALPLLPLRDMVVFPRMMTPLFVGRPRSVAALTAAMDHRREILLVTQRAAKTHDPGAGDLHDVGVAGFIAQMLKLPDGTVRVLVEGRRRVRITAVAEDGPYLAARCEAVDESYIDGDDVRELRRRALGVFETYLDLVRKVARDAAKSISALEDPGALADAMVQFVDLKLDERHTLLETIAPVERLQKLTDVMNRDVELLQAERRARGRTPPRRSDRPQEGDGPTVPGADGDEFRAELKELEDAIESKPLSDEARTRARKELKKLRMMPQMSAEATVLRNYLDVLTGLPWGTYTDDRNDIDFARRVLEEDHFGLEKAKQRILEYLAVQTLVGKLKGPILCFHGPPGVGKTSLARSIARAMNRKFVRMSLGGVRDEAEIRGHRRTYVGALPGKLLTSLKKAESSNPVFLLDEIDKLSSDFRGDPSSALLEALDPEQNAAFNDHYLELDYDLSKVLFIATANHLGEIPHALRDRMEVITIEGYTEHEKLEIARRYLVPKLIEGNGLAGAAPQFADEALLAVMRDHTREAGVRNLERELAAVCRKIAVGVLDAAAAGRTAEAVTVTPAVVAEYLGAARYKRSALDEHDLVGVTNGLAWTETGGEMMPVEVAVVPGTGKVSITGKLGSVMQESAQAALTYVRSRAGALGIPEERFQKCDIHVHVPEGAVPKDGPSAGITMATALASALTGIPVRHEVAMTGEISLRGRVLPIGGLKEKLLAARRQGIREVLVPVDNERDLSEVPAGIRDGLHVQPVAHMDEVLRRAGVIVAEPAAAPEAAGEPPTAGFTTGLSH